MQYGKPEAGEQNCARAPSTQPPLSPSTRYLLGQHWWTNGHKAYLWTGGQKSYLEVGGHLNYRCGRPKEEEEEGNENEQGDDPALQI